MLKVVMYLCKTFSETHSMCSENTATEMCIIFKKRKRVLLCRFTDQLKGTGDRESRHSYHVAAGFLFSHTVPFPSEPEELLWFVASISH